ncbi:MAG: TonB-dependent receptor [Steroidobacteraceae bacterium]
MSEIKTVLSDFVGTLVRYGGGTCALAIFAASAWAQSGRSTPAAGDGARPADEVPLSEVVVTAQRREEQLQDVPISITVLTGASLDQSTQSLTEEIGRVPGIAMVDSNLGGSFISLRGVGSTGTNFAGTNTVGYYLDSVPFGFVRNALTPNASAYDLERVEVLRGPQGTLYGVNSQNGVIRVLTHDVELDSFAVKYRVAGSGTRDGGFNYRGDAALNVPLIDDKLGMRLVAGYEDFDGWIDRPNRKDANDMRRLTLRAKLKARPSDDLTLGMSYWHSGMDSHARPTGFADNTTPVVVDEPMSEDYDIYALQVGYDLGSASLTSVTSWMDYASYSVTDTSYGPGTNLTSSDFRSRVVAQEINVASTLDGQWRWTAGAIYRDVKDEFTQLSPRYVNPRGTQYNDYSASYAGFAEITRLMAGNRLELTGGARYFHDRTRTRPFSILNNANAVLIESRATSSKVSPRVVLTWLPSRDLTFYASYSEGFRGGFPQSPTVKAVAPEFPAVAPDNLLNYEIGSKGTIAGGLIGYDVAVFYIKREDIQQSLSVNAVNGAGAPVRVAAVINGESASGVGTDLGISVRPTRNISFGANYSWNDLQLDADIVPATGGPLYFKGDRPTNSPEHTFSAWFDQQFSIGAYDGHISASLSYISEREARGLVNGVRVLTTSDETLTSRLSLGLTSPSGWGVSLYVDNLNNYNKTPIPDWFISPSGSNRIRPRTIGLQFDHRL